MEEDKEFRKIKLRVLIELAVIAAMLLVFNNILLAGNLTPPATVTSTMRTAEEVYNALVGSFDSSGITASSTGSALQMAKCAIEKISGNSCP